MEFVTGATGHIGANLVRSLLARGRRVRAGVHDGDEALDGLDVERVPLDLLDPESVRRAVAGARVVYHLAARIFLDSAGEADGVRVNVGGTRNVVRACREAGVRRLVHVSSVHALEQRPHDAPLDAARPLAIDTGPLAYDRSKAAAERLALDEAGDALEVVVVSPGAVIGPFDFRPSLIGEFVTRLARGRLPALVSGGYTWVDARDVAEAIVAAAERGVPGRRYLVSGPYATFRELAGYVARASGRGAPRLCVPLGLARALAPLAALVPARRGRRALYSLGSMTAVAEGNRAVDTRPAAADLGFSARPLSETIADTLDWFRRAGRLDGGR